jgi:hypothetical protein
VGGEVMGENDVYPCQECGQRVKGDAFHPYLFCVLYKAGIANQERYLRDSGFVRRTPPKPAPPFTSKRRSKAVR